MNGSKRITIDNTLDERLRLLEDRVSSFFERQVSVTDALIDVARDQERFVRTQREQKVLFIILLTQIIRVYYYPPGLQQPTWFGISCKGVFCWRSPIYPIRFSDHRHHGKNSWLISD